ncbi:MAG: PSD1 and planctomycete cytochrome C domain-containing protein [Chthoniobacteraceae bacterium]
MFHLRFNAFLGYTGDPPDPMNLRARVALLLASLCPSAPASAAELPAEHVEFFETKIRPVLVAECYECHSKKKQKGGLRLDSRDALRAGGDSGAAIVAGKPEESLLITSISHLDPDLKMPSKAPKLEAQVIADFTKWVALGAPDPRDEADSAGGAGAGSWPEMLAARRQWWAFQPLAKTEPPLPKTRDWSEHPIDRFLLAQMEEQGTAPAADAEPHALIRRMTFALTGLPPKPEEVDDFVAAAQVDRSKAIAAAIERMLASPAYGERFARHWMDLVRYAETYGSEHDFLSPYAWRYRDYLVRAFNADLPYDRFVHEQIAGDLIAPRWHEGINEALLGTAWHRMVESYATPVDVKREQASVIDWQIEALGKTFLGLTVQCARCHDHKFDPISAADYYALYGVFASTRPALRILDEPSRLTMHDAELAELKEKLRAKLAERWKRDIAPASLEAVLRRDGKDPLKPLRDLAKADDFPAAWKKLEERYGKRREDAPAFADFTKGDLGGWRTAGPGLPPKPTPSGLLSLSSGDALVRAIQPAGYYSDAISERHGGALRSPEFTIEARAVSVLASGSGKARLRLVIENHQLDLLLFESVNPDLTSPSPRWVTMRMKDQWIGRKARVELLTRDDKTSVGEIKEQEAWAKSDGRSSFGIQRVVLHDGDAPPTPPPFPPAVWQSQPVGWGEFVQQLSFAAEAALEAWAAGRGDDEDVRLLQALLEGGALSNQPADHPEAAAEIARFRELEAKIPAATRAPGVAEDGYSYDSPLFHRGDHTQLGEPVPRRFLEVLGGARLGGTDSGRLELAQALTHPENPLTPRVMANRVWQYLTGRGLVATPDNFGRMGEKPSDAALLDHLALKFVESGWSVKALVRYIATSRAWQLAAEADDTVALRSHAPITRLDAESIRDSMLAVAGNLAPGHTGPGVRIFYRTVIDPVRQPPAGPVDGGGVRSLYLEARRLFSSDFLAAFDAPKPNIMMGKRSATNVPAQSLTLLNDPFVRHQAGVWGKRIAALEGSNEEAIARMYLEAFARPPTAEETTRAAQFLQHAGDEPWRELAHAIFNMKEFIYLR